MVDRRGWSSPDGGVVRTDDRSGQEWALCPVLANSRTAGECRLKSRGGHNVEPRADRPLSPAVVLNITDLKAERTIPDGSEVFTMTKKDVAVRALCRQLPFPLRTWIDYLVVGRENPHWFSEVLKEYLVARGVCVWEDIT